MSAYQGKTMAEVIHDYAVIRGDLSEQYARDQLVRIIEEREAPLIERVRVAEAALARVEAVARDHAGTIAGMDHPEDYCHRCDGPNISWSTPPEVWDPIMRPGGHDTTEWLWNEIICPPCFAEMFEQRFPKTSWRLIPDEATIGGRAFRAAAEGGA